MMIMIIFIVLGVMILGAAIMALYSKDIIGAIVASGVASLLASIIYLAAGSPDVAMTEAAIGSGITTVVFLFAWSRIRQLKKSDTVFEKDNDTTGGISVDPDKNVHQKLIENPSEDDNSGEGAND